MVQRLTEARTARRSGVHRIATTTLVAGLLVGCATEQPAPPPSRYPPLPPPTQTRPPTQPPTTQPSPRPQPLPTPPQAEERPTPKPQSTVTLALQDEAQRAATAGDYAKSIQILERAIRIEPDRAELWLELARVHLKEGNAAQAEQFARKALLFTGNRYDLEQQAWVVIADAKAANH